MLMSFYQKKYNRDLIFNNKILDSLGFRECLVCNVTPNITRDEIPF